MYSIDVALALGLVIWLLWTVAEYLEMRQFWTLRLRISTFEHHLIIPSMIMIWMLIGYGLIFEASQALYQFQFSISLFYIAGTLIGMLGYVLPARHNQRYLRLRWKAWAGPSRTGIRAELVPYIGGRQDWEMLELEAVTRGIVSLHPVERYSSISFLSKRFILSDPTDILLAQETLDQKNRTLWVPHSKVRQGVYQPILVGRSASLLWGEHIGFHRRCSRGIIAVPKYFLSTWPKLADGIDARGLCLASGILARNKGLNPTSFICNLRSKGMISIFEQQSTFWPRPSKTLRSIFRRECKHYYSDLGDIFVTVATELALLLTDAAMDVAEDWLDARLEHQDLELNNMAYNLGAQVHELELLYKGHYAAMLVSLSAHRPGVRIRPEVLVYDAICRSLGMNTSTWAKSAIMENRRHQELEALGPRVMPLIEAII